MTKDDQSRAAGSINLVAGRNHWPLKSDPDLKFVTPQLKAALDIWELKRGTRTMPSRADLSIRDLKSVASNLAFLEILREGQSFRLKARLVGAELERFMGKPMTGSFLDDAVPAPFAEKWLALWTPAIDERAPTRTVGRVEFANKEYYVSETLHAPLGSDGETPDTLMLVSFFHFTSQVKESGNGVAEALMQELSH
jgi:hypothetical protein